MLSLSLKMERAMCQGDEDIEFLNSDESSLPIEGASPPQDKKPQHPHLRGLTLYCH